jgi:predicted dehydrogenase
MESISMDGVRSVALAGLGGYGHIYVNALLAGHDLSRLRFVAGIDPAPDGCSRLVDIRNRGIPVFQSLDAFYDSIRADLVILSTPLQLHCEQACVALSRGYNVLCEKPLGAHPEQVRKMIEARDRAGLQLAIGYQWSFCQAVQNLKRDILEGRFGKPKRLRTRVYWPRDEKYYSRTVWAGKQKDGEGRFVFDSPANNACAHHLHNMFYVLGNAIDSSDWPASVQAELYRAHPIENYDTIALRCLTERGIEVLFYASHATRQQRDPNFAYEFEKGTIRYNGKATDPIYAETSDGLKIDYGIPSPAESVDKLFDVLRCIESNQPVVCGPEAAGAQTACIFAAQQSTPSIVDFPSSMVIVDGKPGKRSTYVKDLEKALNNCFDQAKLPSETGVAWAASGAQIAVAGLDGAEKMRTDAILRPVETEPAKTEVSVSPAASRRLALKR